MFKTRLIQRNRARARLLLYLTPILILGIGAGSVYFLSDIDLQRDWAKVDYTQYEAVRIFQRYLQINTGYPTGNEIPGAEFLARELSKSGIEAHVERLGHRNANLWAVLDGEDPEALVLHNHIDIDPVVSPEAWDHPAFSGFIDLPFIYGRGAFDMKSLAIAQLMAVKRLRDEGQPLARSLVFLATGDEERDSWLGTRWILRHHPELVSRFGVVLTEGGAVEARDIGKVKYWGTETMQKLYVEMQVCTSNRAALEALREDLTFPDYESGHPDVLPAPILEYLAHYIATRDRPDYATELESFLRGAGGFSSLPRNLQATARNQLSAFPVVEDPGGGYAMRLVLQLLPWESIEEATATLLPGGLPGFSVSADVPHEPLPPTGLDHPLFEHLRDRVRRKYSEIAHGPLYIPWAATDARFFRAAGIPAYGFSPFLILSGDAAKITGPDERMVAPAFLEGVELYQDVVRSWVRENP